jgi:hypothetical protein
MLHKEEKGVELMLTKQDMDALHEAIRASLVARQEELKLSDERLGKQAFGFLAAPRMKIQALFVAQGKGERRKPQVINISELINLCEAMGLKWHEEIGKAKKAAEQKQSPS